MELIDKDDLIRYMTATSGFSSPVDLARHVTESGLSEGWLGGFLSAISAVADYQPPACIPPIVHCSDCRFTRWRNFEKEEGGVGYCVKYHGWVNGKNCCASGEREEEYND